MIKVIGQDPTKTYQASCSNCGARLEFTKSDVKSQHGKDYSGGSDGKEWIDCPQCGHEVVIHAW